MKLKLIISGVVMIPVFPSSAIAHITVIPIMAPTCHVTDHRRNEKVSFIHGEKEGLSLVALTGSKPFPYWSIE